MRRVLTVTTLIGSLTVATTVPALACAALIGPNGSVRVDRTTTLAAYHDGVEHYVTSFAFAGGGAEFGAIVPLPGIPTSVVRGGDWALQRLVREVTPPPKTLALAEAASVAADARVLQEVQIDALDVTILEGGGDAVGRWAKDNGFRLTPDFPEILDFYAARSPIFMAARYDLARADVESLAVGDGTPVHLTIPTSNPWVPLRILGAGAEPDDRVAADVFLLTPDAPALLPAPRRGMQRTTSRTASAELLADLRSDQGMDWVPASMWLTHLRLDIPAADLTFDLAVDASGAGQPSVVDAGLAALVRDAGEGTGSGIRWVLPAVIVALGGLVVTAGTWWVSRATDDLA